MSMAMPWPPPTHIVSRPMVLSCDRRLLMQRAGDAGAGHAERVAEGDRAAVDVQLVRGRCLSARQTASTCAANASLISTRSMSSMRHPGLRERLPGRLDRAEAHDLGARAR